jgi:glyoxylase-like metal-dependent hydrolase (beta-lactamase superfamily II)
MRLADLINYLFTYDALAPELIPVNNWRPQDPRRYEERRKAKIAYLRERNLYILDGHFTPTKAANTDITVIFNRERQQLGAQLIQVAK